MSNRLRAQLQNVDAHNETLASNTLNNVIVFLKQYNVYDESWICKRYTKSYVYFVLSHPLTDDDAYQLEMWFFVTDNKITDVRLYTAHDNYFYAKVMSTCRFNVTSDFLIDLHTNINRSWQLFQEHNTPSLFDKIRAFFRRAK